MISQDALPRVPFLDRLSPAARRALAARASVWQFRAGEVLWTAGSPIDRMLVVIEGEVRVIRESGGRQHVLHTEGPGGTLGEVPFYSGGSAPATAIATMATRCVILSREAIEAAIVADPAVAWVLLDRLASRVRGLVERVDRLALQSVTTRLVGLLLAKVPRTTIGGDAEVGLGMSQEALAAELGTVREVVVRALRSLRESGLIASAGRGRIHITDVAALRRMTDDSESARDPQSQRE
ncbi:MAG TPA: Crp/Fnr family transcriptional regulator [Gemmatimonadaceae bacterium]|nr:Crp/Fnr family transcriptional regulator [Gemmatimonadaceae bacterium]